MVERVFNVDSILRPVAQFREDGKVIVDDLVVELDLLPCQILELGVQLHHQLAIEIDQLLDVCLEHLLLRGPYFLRRLLRGQLLWHHLVLFLVFLDGCLFLLVFTEELADQFLSKFEFRLRIQLIEAVIVLIVQSDARAREQGIFFRHALAGAARADLSLEGTLPFALLLDDQDRVLLVLPHQTVQAEGGLAGCGGPVLEAAVDVGRLGLALVALPEFCKQLRVRFLHELFYGFR